MDRKEIGREINALAQRIKPHNVAVGRLLQVVAGAVFSHREGLLIQVIHPAAELILSALKLARIQQSEHSERASDP